MTWLQATLGVRPGLLSTPADYLALTKPGIVRLVLVVTALSFYLASGPAPAWALLGHTLLGTAMAAGGAGALNQLLERDADARMRRTRARPLPAGRLTPAEAAGFGLALGLAGTLYLALRVNPLTALLAAATQGGYLLAYTPLKRRSALCTLAGAAPGAAPAVAGWAAARASLEAGAWVLFAIVFLWQIPHFLALSWLYRRDYARAGFRMISLTDPDGRLTGALAMLSSLGLVAVSLWPALLGLSRPAYPWPALALGAAFTLAAGRFLLRPGDGTALTLFRASLVYLPLLLASMALLKT